MDTRAQRWAFFISLFAVIISLFAVIGVWVGVAWLPNFINIVERASAALAVIDDLLLRVAGVFILVAGTIGLVRHAVDGIGEDAGEVSRQYLLLIKFGAAVLLSGGAFFAGYNLDRLDNDAEKLLGAPGNPAPSEAALSGAPAPTILAAWIQVVSDERCRGVPKNSIKADASVPECPPRFRVRAVVDKAASCAAVALEYQKGRTGPDRAELRERRVDRLERLPEFRRGFGPIKVCEGDLPHPYHLRAVRFADGYEIKITEGWDRMRGPGRIAILGDSGCRDDNQQSCTQDSWPFRTLAQTVRAEQPNLVLHLGDLMYVAFDSWGAWRDYFFTPASPLLTAAPWVFVRGNHERCGQHGQAPLGFYLFFGQGDGVDCGEDEELISTYAVDLTDDHRLIVADSSIAFVEKGNPKCAPEDEECQPILSALKSVFTAAGKLAGGKKTVWLATHVPPFALEWKKEQQEKPNSNTVESDPETRYVTAFPETSAMMLLLWRQEQERLGNVDVILSADRHLFQVLRGRDKRPYQVTVGTGGVNLDDAPEPSSDGPPTIHTGPPGESFWLTDNDRAELCTYRAFGYLMVDSVKADKHGKGGYRMAFHPHNETYTGSARPCADSLP